MKKSGKNGVHVPFEISSNTYRRGFEGMKYCGVVGAEWLLERSKSASILIREKYKGTHLIVSLYKLI